MKNRMNIAPWPDFPARQPPRTGTSHTMCADRPGDGVDPVELCEIWRAWEAGASSEFLNWFLFTPHGTSSGTRTALLEDWICFRDGTSELDPRAKTVLGDKVKLFRKHPTMRIVIGGLASRPGPVAPGMRLGLRRVLSIRTFLIEHGIDPIRIGIAIRGSGWSVAERSHGMDTPARRRREYRLQVTDPLWVLARN